MKKKYRKIVIDERTYCWKFTPGYIRAADEWDCRDKFTAYLQSARKSILQVYFRTWEDAISGGPLRCGAALSLDGSGLSGINLHTPGWAARLIRHALATGWQPEHSQQPFIIAQGVDFLQAGIPEEH